MSPVYHYTINKHVPISSTDTVQYFGRSEKICAENLFKRDNLVRESQLIVDWLESCAADRDDEVLTFSDSTLGWENTLHQLESADNIAFRSTRQIVTEMDPDAPHRQKRPLHDLDMEDDKRLARRVFNEIRCGKLEEAQKVKSIWKYFNTQINLNFHCMQFSSTLLPFDSKYLQNNLYINCRYQLNYDVYCVFLQSITPFIFL